MKTAKRLLSLLLCLLLLSGTALAASGKNSQDVVLRKVPEQVIAEVPETIQELLDLAYAEWQATDGAELKDKNKYTKWRNNYAFGWCGGFVTYCALEVGIPQQEKNKTKEGDVEGFVHVKEAGVGKLYDGYKKLNRLTNIPQKGFIAVFGNGKQFGDVGMTPYYHVGLVYDVEQLSEGKYRITTIEGNVTSPGDETHKKAPHTVRMFIRDYDLNAEKKAKNLSLVPEEERDREESAVFSYGYTYNNQNLYLTMFLMPWIPDGTDAAGE